MNRAMLIGSSGRLETHSPPNECAQRLRQNLRRFSISSYADQAGFGLAKRGRTMIRIVGYGLSERECLDGGQQDRIHACRAAGAGGLGGCCDPDLRSLVVARLLNRPDGAVADRGHHRHRFYQSVDFRTAGRVVEGLRRSTLDARPVV
jgi:hypothetical protein